MADGPSDEVPDVRSTSLDRTDLAEAAEELGLEDVDDLDDQELLERIGVALGALDEGQAEMPEGRSEAAQDQGREAADEADEPDRQADEPDRQADEPDQAEATADEPDQAEATADDAGDADDDADEEADASDQGAADADEADAATDHADGDGDGDGDGDDRTPVHEAGEYRFEDDPREGIEPVLDLELGPVAIDVLGVEIHLRRVHAALTANPNGPRNVVGKLLAGLTRLAGQSGDEVDQDADQDQDEDHDQDADQDQDEDHDQDADQDQDDEEGGGLLHKITSPARSVARGVKHTLTRN